MQIRDWRENQKPRWSLDRTGKALGAILGENVSARTLHRNETGESQAPTMLMEAALVLTGGLVRPGDWHAARLRYLQSRPGFRPLVQRAAVAAE